VGRFNGRLWGRISWPPARDVQNRHDKGHVAVGGPIF